MERYQVPTFLFLNKMDLPGMEKEKLLAQLQKELSPGCIDFSTEFDEIAESAAMCDEALLETYLETGTVTEGNLRGLIAGRKIFPCCFGSALKLEGVDGLLDLLDAYAPERNYPDAFGARVYKISRDPQGVRLTWLKITGGKLRVRESINYVNFNFQLGIKLAAGAEDGLSLIGGDGIHTAAEGNQMHKVHILLRAQFGMEQ